MCELGRSGGRLNALGALLQRESADDRILIDRMMALQELEREDLERELHDEFGSALFFRPAEIVGLLHLPPGEPTVADRFGALETMIEDLQWRNRARATRRLPSPL